MSKKIHELEDFKQLEYLKILEKQLEETGHISYLDSFEYPEFQHMCHCEEPTNKEALDIFNRIKEKI